MLINKQMDKYIEVCSYCQEIDSNTWKRAQELTRYPSSAVLCVV